MLDLTFYFYFYFFFLRAVGWNIHFLFICPLSENWEWTFCQVQILRPRQGQWIWLPHDHQEVSGVWCEWIIVAAFKMGHRKILSYLSRSFLHIQQWEWYILYHTEVLLSLTWTAHVCELPVSGVLQGVHASLVSLPGAYFLWPKAHLVSWPVNGSICLRSSPRSQWL